MNHQGLLSIDGAIADLPQGQSATTAQPMPVPPAGPTDSGSGLLLILLLVWALLSLMVAYLLGAFRRNSIRGPERLEPDESVWWLMMILCGSFLAAGRITAGLGISSLNLPKNAKELVSQGALEMITVVLIVIVSLFVRKGAARLIGIRLFQIPMGVVGGLAAIFVLFPLSHLSGDLVTAAYTWLHLQQPEPHEVLRMIASAPDRTVTIIAVSLPTVVAPCFEELCFRGILQTMLGRLFSLAFGTPLIAKPASKKVAIASESAKDGSKVLSYATPPPAPFNIAPPVGVRARWAAVIMTSVMFAAFHWQPAWFLPLFLLSLGLGYIYERTGNLWTSITAHAMFNVLQIVIFSHLR